MSLTDALLLDPHRDVREAWIAARQDGQRGSGVQSDPYNATPIPYPALSITSLTRNGQTATAVTGGNHGFRTGEMVSISGVSVSSIAKAADASYIGTFPITFLGPNSFTYTMLGVPSTSPATGTIQCWREREQFDVILRGLPANCAIHLGPGVFETKGLGGWTARTGQRITGAGMGLTTLKLVGAAGPYNHYIAIAAVEYLEGFEVLDLTVDCNLEGQLNPHTVCAAIVIGGGGRHIRIRRVRAINFGSRSPDDFYVENFVFFIGAWPYSPPTVDCAFEECVAEQPSPNNRWNSSIFLIGGNGEEAWRGQKASNYACAIKGSSRGRFLTCASWIEREKGSPSFLHFDRLPRPSDSQGPPNRNRARRRWSCKTIGS